MLVEVLAATTTFGVYKYLFPNNKTKIKRLLQKLFIEKNLKNKKGYYPNILSIALTGWGAIVRLDIKNIISFVDLEKQKDYLKTSFGALDVELTYKNESIEIQLFMKELQDIKYRKLDLNPYELLLGYDFKGIPIIVDMRKTPHLLVSGLSGQGKSGMVKAIIKNIDSRVFMLNGFKEDYKDINNIVHINGENAILQKLESILKNQYKREKPLYIFVEELSTIKNKKIISALKELLCIARHFNVFVVGIIQVATKEELTCKTYFNSRVSFRQIDGSSYSVALGVNISEPLQKRYFYLLSNGLYKGKTYLLE